jgi:hypothetical protein
MKYLEYKNEFLVLMPILDVAQIYTTIRLVGFTHDSLVCFASSEECLHPEIVTFSVHNEISICFILGGKYTNRNNFFLRVIKVPG